jgi:hypothetical protein
MAYKNSDSDQGADLYYFNVTSMLSIMKTSVYLVETLACNLFVVRSPITIHCPRECSSSASPVVSCYIVWSPSLFITILPVLLYITGMGAFHADPGVLHILNCDHTQGPELLLSTPCRSSWTSRAPNSVLSKNRKLVLLLHSHSEHGLLW